MGREVEEGEERGSRERLKRERKGEIKKKLKIDRERMKKGKKGGETGRKVEEGEERGRKERVGERQKKRS